MNYLLVLCLFAVTTGGYAADKGWLPGAARFIPEIVTGIVVLLIVAEGVRTRYRNFRPEYLLVLAVMALVVIGGVVANQVSVGPALAGLRMYLRAAPLFLLPAVMTFSDREIRLQLQALLLVALAQLPLSIEQKQHEMFYGNSSGDNITGTLASSGYQSVFLIGAACVITAFFMRRRVGFWTWVLLMTACLGPIAINETKASFLMLPLGLFVTAWIASPARARARNMMAATATLVVSAAIIVPIYDYWADQRPQTEGGGISVLKFFTDERVFDAYMSYDSDKDTDLLGRGAAYRKAGADVIHGPVRAVLGFGLGNASRSTLGVKYSGDYAEQYWPVLQTSAIRLMLELGFAGLLLALLFKLLVYQDATIIARRESSLTGALAAGWCGALAVVVFASFYTDLFLSVPVSYTFWYLSGVVAAERYRVAANGRSP